LHSMEANRFDLASDIVESMQSLSAKILEFGFGRFL